MKHVGQTTEISKLVTLPRTDLSSFPPGVTKVTVGYDGDGKVEVAVRLYHSRDRGVLPVGFVPSVTRELLGDQAFYQMYTATGFLAAYDLGFSPDLAARLGLRMRTENVDLRQKGVADAQYDLVMVHGDAPDLVELTLADKAAGAEDSESTFALATSTSGLQTYLYQITIFEGATQRIYDVDFIAVTCDTIQHETQATLNPEENRVDLNSCIGKIHMDLIDNAMLMGSKQISWRGRRRCKVTSQTDTSQPTVGLTAVYFNGESQKIKLSPYEHFTVDLVVERK